MFQAPPPSVTGAAWHRLLGLPAGADAIAARRVVGAFLLGLGVGSLSAGLYADRLSRRAAFDCLCPLCEVGMALFSSLESLALLRRHLPRAASDCLLSRRHFAPWCSLAAVADLPHGLLAARFSKAIFFCIAGSAQLIGWLYGFNTLGAGVGAPSLALTF